MIQLHNPTDNAPIDTQSVHGPVVIPVGATVSVSEETAAELRVRYPFLQVVTEAPITPAPVTEEAPAAPADVQAEEPKTEQPVDLTKLTKLELSELAKQRGVETHSAMTKKDLIEKLSLQ